MATDTYTALVARVASIANRSDLGTKVDDWIGDFEAKANRWMRERRMQARSTATITDEFSTLPADYAEAMTISLTDGANTWELTPTPPEVMETYAQTQQTGQPRFYGIVGTEIRYYPVPSASYTATFNYYQKLEAISGSNATNWLLTDAPDVYVQGVMAGYHEWDKDYSSSDRAFARAEQIFQELLMARRTPVGPLRNDEITTLAPRRTGFNVYRGF